MRPIRDLSIKTKFTLAIISLLILMGSASFCISYMLEKNSLLKNMKSHAIVLNKALTISITSRKDIADKVRLQELVEEVSLTEGMFGVWVVDTNQRVIAATFREDVGKITESNIIPQVLEKGYYISGFDSRMGEKVFAAAYPLRIDGELCGAVEAVFEIREYLQTKKAFRKLILRQMDIDARIMAESLSYIIRKMEAVRKIVHLQRLVKKLAGESENIYEISVTDEDGRVIASNIEEKIKTIADNKWVRSVMSGSDLAAQLLPSQKLYIIAMPFRKGERLEGVIYVSYRADDYYKNLAKIFKFGLLLSIGSVIWGVFFAIQLSKPVISPLKRLTEVTKQLARGALEQRASVESRDEIGELALAFNKMAEDLKNSRDEIEKYSKTLEKKVEERTKELALEKDKIEAILKSIADGLFTIDRQWRITSFNEAAEELTGYKAEEAIGKKCMEIFKADECERNCPIKKSIESGRACLNVEMSIFDKNNEKRAIMASAAPLMGIENKPIGGVEVFKDISEIKRLIANLEKTNWELLQMQEELKKADRAKTEFLSTASHELRTPLTTLLGYSELLLTRSLDEKTKEEFLTFIHEESIHLARLVNNLLDISRIEAKGEFEIERNHVQLLEIIQKNIHFFMHSTDTHRFITKFENNIPPVWIDPEKISQVIKNLLDNAIKYSKGGDITCCVYKKDGCIWVSIEDQGIGIPKEDLPYIFDKFYRGSRPDIVNMRGTGLGLSISKQIVEAHGGEIKVESKVGKGTKVVFNIPINGGQHEEDINRR